MIGLSGHGRRSRCVRIKDHVLHHNLESFESPSAVLLFPQGPASLHFYGRAVLLPSRKLVTLFGAQQREQNDCMFLHGLGDTVYDVGLLSDGGGEECVVEGVTASGGTLARLATAGWGGGGSSGGGGGDAPPAAALFFEPTALVEGAPAAAAAAKFFPEVRVPAESGDALVVFGAVRAANCAWRPAFVRGAAGGAAPVDSVAALISRFAS
jgi:hypothetical protein